MSEDSQQGQNHMGISKEVLIAIIGAIATVLAAALAAAIGLLPNLLGGQDPKPEPTVVAISTPAPPAAVDVAAIPAATAQPPLAPTAVASLGAPTSAGGYPCDATVSYWQAGTLNVVRDFPNDGALLRDTISVGTSVRVIDISGTSLPWYRIASPDGRVLGWIPEEYLTLATTCPHP